MGFGIPPLGSSWWGQVKRGGIALHGFNILNLKAKVGPTIYAKWVLAKKEGKSLSWPSI